MGIINFIKLKLVLITLLLASTAYANISTVSNNNVIMSGDGYQLREIVYVDANGETRTVEQYYINNVDGAVNAYLNAGLPFEEVVAIQEEVDDWGGAWGSSANTTRAGARTATATSDEPQFTWVIDRRGATITTDAEADQYIADFDLQSVVAAELLVPNGDVAAASATASANRLFKIRWCNGWRQGNKHFNKVVDENFSHNKSIGSGAATLNFEGKLNVDATIDLDLSYQYYRNFACIPYKFRFRQLDTKASYEAIGDLTLTGKLEKSLGDYNWKIAEPQVLEVWFAIGPVPVRVAMKLPIEVGTGTINMKAVGLVDTYKPIHFKGNFSYTCTPSTCYKVSSNHQNFNKNLQSTIGASASASVTAKPYVHVAAKPILYGEWFLYAQVGVKPSFPLELFGYYGNLCDDGDNNGTNETVAAALGTVAFEVGITGTAEIFNQTILQPKYWRLWYKDLLMLDFLSPGSSAFSPVLRPSVSSGQLTVGLPIAIRSCVSPYASRFPVNYSINWGDGTSSQLSGVASSKQLSHNYANAGTYPVTVSYKNGVSTTVMVTVTDDWGGAW